MSKIACWLGVLSMVSCAAPNTQDQVVALAALEPNAECLVSPDSTVVATGMFDVGESEHCATSYNIALLVENHAVGPTPRTDGTDCGPNVTQMTRALVSLVGDDDSLIELGPMPNPFTAATYATIPPSSAEGPGLGVALLEAIPSAYRPHLRARARAGLEVVAVIELSGTTTGGQTISTAPFRFPIQLCDGCLSHCASELTPEEIDTLTNGQCNDNAGADGRVCVDHGC